jgi:hypothetical protein
MACIHLLLRRDPFRSDFGLYVRYGTMEELLGVRFGEYWNMSQCIHDMGHDTGTNGYEGCGGGCGWTGP